MIAVIVQFGCVFLATDMVARKGAAMTVPFPVLIVAVAGFSVWFTGFATRRGWIG